MFFKIGALENSAIFPGKTMCGSHLFSKVPGLKAILKQFFYRTPLVTASKVFVSYKDNYPCKFP